MSDGPAPLRVGELFAGIGGFGLGLERAGMHVRWQCEINEYRRGILARHWPDIPKYADVRELCADDVEPIDVLAGGFPCTGTSDGGLRTGLDHASSGLWFEMLRLVRELAPRWVIIENADGLVRRGLHEVLAGLASCGLDAEWDVLSAAQFGAPHRRRRVWVVAYPAGVRCSEGPVARVGAGPCEQAQDAIDRWAARRHEQERGPSRGSARWPAEPDVARVGHGIPHRVDRAAALGASLVPDIVEWIGRRVIAADIMLQSHAPEVCA